MFLPRLIAHSCDHLCGKVLGFAAGPGRLQPNPLQCTSCFASLLPPAARLCSKALGTKLSQMGFNLPQEQLNEVFKRFKSIADKKKVGLERDLIAGNFPWLSVWVLS